MSENLPEKCDFSAPAVTNQFIGASFKETMEIAEFFAKSDLIPAHFQGKAANVFIALELAARMEMSPFMVMQSLFVVYGRPGLEGKFLIALANRAGWNLQYDIEHDKAGNIISCTAYSDKGGVHTRGPKITAQLVQNEGWNKPKPLKGGGQMPSKWVTMPDLMYRYRAGAYFVNTVCPQLRMGMATVEELEDILEIEPVSVETKKPKKGKETSPAPEPATEDDGVMDSPADVTFEASLAQYTGDASRIDDYLAAMAAHFKTDVSGAKGNAVKDWPNFIAYYEKWLSQQKKQEEKKDKAPPKDPPNDEPPIMADKEQIEEIVALAGVKNFPIATLLDKYRVSALEEMDIRTANQAMDYLASL